MGLPEIENFEVWVSAQKKKKSSVRGKKGVKAAPGINALKGLILNFAVQGKLTSRNPKAEKAADLLLRVNKKWDGLKRNRVPKEAVEKVSNVSNLPENWVSTCLNEIALLGPKNEIADDQLASFVPMPLITTSLDGRHDFEKREWGSIKKGYTHFANGDIGLAKITPCFENSKAAVFSGLINNVGTGTTELHVARPISAEIDPKFILLVLKSNHFLTNGIPRMTGTAGQKRVPRWYFQFYEFGLPPLEEQKRIVAKVDELMALIDDLEAQTETARVSHAELVDALLRTLVESEDANALDQNWNTLSTHFDALFTTEESVEKLKGVIYKTAIAGILSCQIPTDNSALSWLEKIAEKRNVYLSEGRPTEKESVTQIKKQRQQFIPANLPKLPQGWSWATLMQTAAFVIDCKNKTAPYSDSGIGIVRTTNVRHGKYLTKDLKFITQKVFDDWSLRGKPMPGDLLITREAPMGEACLIPEGETICLGQRMMLARFFPDLICTQYMLYTFMSPDLMDRVQDKPIGMTVQHLRVGGVETVLIPVPPLEEQKRIVTRVDELIALCDKLLLNIRVSEMLKIELAESAVHHASAC